LLNHALTASRILVAASFALTLAACGRTPEPQPTAAPSDPAPALAAGTAAAEADRAAEFAAKEQALAEREAAVKQQELEQELARRDAENAAAAAAAEAEKAKAAAAAAQKKAAAKAATAAAAAAPAPKPAASTPLVVPAGTQLAVALVTPLNSKTAKVGDPVQAQLQSDVMVDGRRAVAAGATVNGAVTQVVSGSRKIGGTPSLGVTFDSLILGSGASVPISGQLVQQGKSETGRDTAKIVGGAAAGAILGHQIDDDKGSVIGGLLGGAAGTAAAQKTGGEVDLPAGTVATATTSSSFEVAR
jgi:hypothetical protein